MPSVTNLFPIMGVSVSPQCSERLMDFSPKTLEECARRAFTMDCVSNTFRLGG